MFSSRRLTKRTVINLCLIAGLILQTLSPLLTLSPGFLATAQEAEERDDAETHAPHPFGNRLLTAFDAGFELPQNATSLEELVGQGQTLPQLEVQTGRSTAGEPLQTITLRSYAVE